MRFFKRKSQLPEDPLVWLTQAARKDPELRRQLLGILRVDSFNRRSLLNTFIHELRLQGAPTDLIAALAWLRDDAVADTVQTLLEEV